MSKNLYQSRPSDHLAGSRRYHHGPLEPMDYAPAPGLRLRTKILLVGLASAVLLWGFDHTMRADKANLCASEATAYKGCRH